MIVRRIVEALKGDLRLQILALPCLALVCALLSNAFAAPSRRVPWLGRPETPVPVVEAPAPAAAVPPAPALAPEPSRPSPGRPRDIPKEAPRADAPSREERLMEAQRRFPPSGEEMARDIHSQDAWEAWRLGVPFLDARRSAEYAAGHVKGAWSLPVWEADLQERLQRFDASGHPMKAPVVIYCDGGDCLDSGQLAAKLYALGYRCLLIYKDGYPDWVGLRRPVQAGAAP